VYGERHQSDADAAAAVCEQRTRETCGHARYRMIYGRHDIVCSTNPRSISRYRVIDMITTCYVVVAIGKYFRFQCFFYESELIQIHIVSEM